MFNSARLKLTAWYLLTIMIVSILFSGIIYKLLMMEFDRFEKAQRFRFERRLVEGTIIYPNGVQLKVVPQHMSINEELIEETRKRVIVMLISINSGILIISGVLGYVLAGRTLKPIKDMMEEQNRFIGDASHEIRTPLTSLKSAFEVFLRDKKATIKEAKEIVSDSIDEVNKLKSLSDSLLQLAQYEKPNGHSDFKKIPLDKILSDATESILPMAKEKQVKVIFNNTDFTLDGNLYALTDLFIILLDNAVKYSPQNSTVKIKVNKTNESIIVSVFDEGTGVDKKDIPHIFERFYRSDKARSKQSQNGYGLGLSIAKKIVELHKGTISVKNNPEKGSVFMVSLPTKKSLGFKKPFVFS